MVKMPDALSWTDTQEFIDDEIYAFTMRYYHWALAFYIKDPFSQLKGNDIDG